MKKLTRSINNKVIGGVLGGFAEYFTIDPTIVRLAYVFLTLWSPFPGIIFYIITWIVIPKHIIVKETHHTEATEENKTTEKESETN